MTLIYDSIKLISVSQCTAQGGGVQMYDYENSPEPDLIRRARRGDAKAFAQLYSRIYKELYKFALYMTRHPQEAEDAVSETVVSAYENISALRKEDSFRSWIFTILNNQCRKRLTKNKRETPVSGETYAHIGAGAESEPDYAGQQDVHQAFAELDEEERMIIAFSVFGGYQSDEIARMLGKNPATVRSRKSRALGKMRVRLGGAKETD